MMSNFKQFRKSTGLTLKQFSKLYKIPYRTLQNWEYGLTEPPHYVFKLIVIAWYNFYGKEEAK